MTSPSEVSGGRLMRNTMANGVSSLVLAAIALVLTPIFLEDLGQAEYGVWLLATGLTFGAGYIGLADLGLQQAGVRFIAEARSRGDTQAVSELASTTVALFAVVGSVVAVAIVALSGPLVSLFGVEGDLAAAARLVFVLVGLQIAIDLPAAGLLAVVEGAQRYGSLRLIETGGRLLWAVCALVAVVLGHGIVAMALLSVFAGGVSAIAAVFAARRAQPDLHLRLGLARFSTLAKLFRFSSSLVVLRVLSMVYRQMDRVIIGVVLTAAAVAQYEVAYKIHATAALVLTIAPSAVMPAAAYVGAACDREKLRALYLRGTRYAVALSLPVTIATLLYARALIVAWVGPEYADLSGVTRLFLLYPALVAVHTIGITMLVGLGRMKEMLVLNIAAVGLNLLVSVALVPHFGIAGVVWGTLVGYVIIWIPYLRIFLREFEVNLPTWFRQTLLPIVPAVVVQVAVGMLTVGWVDSFDALWQVAGAWIANCALGVVTFGLVVGRDERRQIFKMLRRGSADPATTPALPVVEPS